MNKYKSSLIAVVFWVLVLMFLTINNIGGWRFINLSRSLNDIRSILTSSDTLGSILTTMIRLIKYVILITLIALVTSFGSYKFKFIEELLKPLNIALKAIPVVASILLIYLIFDSNNVSFIIVFLMAFPILNSTFTNTLNSIDKSWIRHNRVHNVKLNKQVTKMYLPLLFFKNKAQIIATIGLSLKSLVAAEILTTTRDGVGSEINDAKWVIDIDLMFAWIVILTMIIFVIDISFKKLMKVGDHNE